jgi:hypothetical protein
LLERRGLLERDADGCMDAGDRATHGAIVASECGMRQDFALVPGRRSLRYPWRIRRRAIKRALISPIIPLNRCGLLQIGLSFYLYSRSANYAPG